MRKTILLIDDDKDFIDLYSKVLSKEFKVLTSMSLPESLEVVSVQKFSIDLIICDIFMPEFSGFQVFNFYKSNSTFSHIPIIFKTSSLDESIMNKCMIENKVELIHTMMSNDEIIVRVKKELATAKQERDILKKATAYFLKTIELDATNPVFAEAHVYIGSRELRKGNYVTAKEYLDFALANTPSSTMLYHELKSKIEICNNGIDDDGDGLIDLFDNECDCLPLNDTIINLIGNGSSTSLPVNLIGGAYCGMSIQGVAWDDHSGFSERFSMSFNGTPHSFIQSNFDGTADNCHIVGNYIYGLQAFGAGGFGQWTYNLNSLPVNINNIIFRYEDLSGNSGGANATITLSSCSLIDNVTPNGGICSEDLILTASTTLIGGNWQWYKNNIALVGETSSILNISANNYGLGDYTIKLTIGNKCATMNYSVNTPEYPIASINFDTVCNNLITNYTDLSTVTSGNITTWEWDFGDGNNSLIPSPTHTFQNDGTYSTTLIVTSDIGCKDTITENVIVYPNPQATFTVDDACLQQLSIFQNTSSISTPDNISNYTWTLGDGNTANTENPTHTYLTEGTYNLKLITESNHGCLDSLLTTTRVHPKPTADFSVNDDCLNVAAQFTDNSTIPSGAITNWEWDFDDATPTDVNQNPSHFYTADGTYQPQLIVISSFGCRDTIIKQTIRHALPVVGFSAAPVCLYDSILIVNNSSINTPSTISNYIWNFGDGSPFSTEENPKHKYNLDGIYNITLIASSNFGCVTDLSIPVQIYPIPVASFSNSNVCENKPPMYFIDVSSVNNGSISNWQWDFGDGNLSTFPIPNHSYTTAGTYDVQLIVTSNNNCKDTTETTVTVDPKPNAEFIVNLTEGCSPLCVNYTDNSTSNATSITEWQWNLGNGEGSFLEDPSTCYENPSNTDDVIYNTSLIIKNNKGCYDTIYKSNLITSWHNPLAEFEASPDEINMYEAEISTFNTTSGADSYSWDFNNSFTSIDFEPTATYSDTGVYNIILAVSTLNNCVDTTTRPVKITPIASIYIPNTFTPNGDGYNDGFIYSGFGIDKETTKFYIFDRWGTQIYYTENSTPWDGTYKNEKALQDTYVYKLYCKDILGKSHEYIGHFTLLK